MSDDNYHANTTPHDPSSVSIDSALEELKQWRNNKRSSAESMPDSLWMKIFSLAERHSMSAIRTLFGITSKQFEIRKHELLGYDKSPHSASKDNVISLCQANVTVDKPYQLSPLPDSSKNIIVEFCRADGKVMKIHTTTDSYEILMNNFFNAINDVND